MRKYLLLSLGLSVLTANARQISPQEAAKAANEFINTHANLTRDNQIRLMSANAKGSSFPYYVFNATEDNGFVIISGDDRFSKVLGYSDRGTFNEANIPPQLKAMLEKFAEKTANPSGSSIVHTSWTTTALSTRAEEGILLETVNWGQGAPYNNLCPTVGGKKAPTGCVATAMAIAMKYHNWPDYTRGDVQTDYYFPELGFDFSNHKIDWKALDNPGNPKFADEVSKLMFSAGVCNSMAYGPEESSAVVWPVGHKMIELYTYAKGNQFVRKERYSDEEWKSMLKHQLEKVGPVIYSGDGSGAHCFIIDGYDGEGLYHINWGWDGDLNGYYALGAAEEVGNLFPNNQGMIIDLKPDKERKVYSKAFIPNVQEYESQEWNFSYPDITPGERQQVLVPTITQNCFSGYYGLAVVDENDNIKQIFHTTPAGTGIRSDCPYPGVYWGCLYQGEKGLDFPKLNKGERYQLVTMDATYETNGQENAGFWTWIPALPSNNPSDWKIVLGGIDYPSYFYDKGNKSDVSEVTFHVDEDLPVYMSINHKYPTSEPFTIRQLKWESVADNLYVPKKGFSVEIKCRDKDGTPKDPIWLDDGQYKNGTGIFCFNITTSEDYYDVYLKYEADNDTRKDSDLSKDEIVEENGIVYKIEKDKVIVIGYDNLPESITIPGQIKTRKGSLPVEEIEKDAFLHAPIKHLSFESERLIINDLSLAGMDNLQSISFGSKNWTIDYGYGYPLLHSNLKNLYFDRFPLSKEIEYLLGVQYWQANGTSFWDPFEPDSATTDQHDVNLYINTIPVSPEHSIEEWIQLLEFFNRIKSGYKLDNLVTSITIPGVGEMSAAANAIKKYDLPLRQMWTYSVDTRNKLVKIDDVISEVKINSVMINGVKVDKNSDGLYHYGDTRSEEFSVSIAYQLNSRKEVVTEYSTDYNSSISDVDLTGAIEIIDGTSEPVLKDVLNLQGIRILEKATQDDIRSLPSGVYVIGKKKVRI